MTKATNPDRVKMFASGRFIGGCQCDRCADAGVMMAHTGSLESVTVLCAAHFQAYRTESREQWRKERGAVMAALGL